MAGASCVFFFFLLLHQQPAAESHGPPSVADSAAEYFDASYDVICGSSSDVSDESGLSEGSTTDSEPEEGHGGSVCTRLSPIRPISPGSKLVSLTSIRTRKRIMFTMFKERTLDLWNEFRVPMCRAASTAAYQIPLIIP